MKTKRCDYTAPKWLLYGLVLLLAGCGSTGMERSSNASTTMQTVDDDIRRIVVQLDATGKALDYLLMPGQSDVSKAFDSYSGHVSSIEKMEREFSNHVKKMQERGIEYFSEWEKEGDKYNNPNIQARSEQRRMELSRVYGRIAENSVGMDAAFKTYVSDVTEIRKFLSTDLTSRGIEAISPISTKVVNDGANLKYAIRNVQDAIKAATAEMAQQGI